MTQVQDVPVRVGNVGRPSTTKAIKRQEELFDRALDLFLEHGFEMTTMDAVVRSVGMTKRTIYSRYADKAAFFRAIVLQAIEQVVIQQAPRLLRLEGETLEGVLTAVARMRIQQVMTTDGMRLQRILNAEAFRFPDLFDAAYRHIAKSVVDFLANVLARHSADGKVAVARPEMAAAAFMNMVAGAAVRQSSLGNQMEEGEIEDRISFSVELFLNGIKAQPASGLESDSH